MTFTIRMLFIVCLFAVSTSLYAQLPTPDQVGLYTGKGTVVINMELDTPKPPKQAASYAVVINSDGSMDMQIVLEGGSLASGIGEGGFGASGAIYRVEIDALIAAGRLNFKGKGAKLKATGTVNLLLPGYIPFGEGDLKLKKVSL